MATAGDATGTATSATAGGATRGGTFNGNSWGRDGGGMFHRLPPIPNCLGLCAFRKDFGLAPPPALGHPRTAQVRTAMPTPPRFASPTLAPGPKSIGTQRRPRSRGGVGVGRYWGRSPGSVGATCRWDGDGWVRCPTTGSSPHPLRPPVYQSRSACAGVVIRGLGELEANAWYSRTPYLQRRFPRARPPQGGGHDFAYRYRCVDVLLYSVFFSVFCGRTFYVAGMMPGRCACRVERWRCKRFLRRCSGSV